MTTRLEYLDGLRGVAILLVLGVHAYASHLEHVPYGNLYQNFPLFKFGWLGVQLFFLISGFVIFMTLDKTINFRLFIYKRWLRLFPAMLLVSIVIYFTAPIFDERPAGIPDFWNVVPGLSFVEPAWWSKLLGFKISSLEGAFWSIYVEFKFYLLAGLIYFFLGRIYLIPSLFLLFVGSLLITYFSEKMDTRILNIMHMLSIHLSLKYFGWFCSGATFYLYHQTKKEHYFWMAIVVAIFSSLFVGSIFSTIAAIIIAVLFAASLKVIFIQRLLMCKFFMFFGLISYPLYLLHENLMIAMIVKLPNYLSWMSMFFYPFVSVMVLSIISYFIATKYEIKIRVSIEGIINSLRLGKT